MKKHLLIFMSAITSLTFAQSAKNYSFQPISPTSGITETTGGKKCDHTFSETGGEDMILIGPGKKKDFHRPADTGGDQDLHLGTTKKQDFALSLSSGGGQCIDPGKKMDFLRLKDRATGFANENQQLLDTGGVVPGGSGKKLDFAAAETGGTGQSIDQGKKLDAFPMNPGFATLNTGGGVKVPSDGKKLDFDSGDPLTPNEPGKKKDIFADTGGETIGKGGKKQDDETNRMTGAKKQNFA